MAELLEQLLNDAGHMTVDFCLQTVDHPVDLGLISYINVFRAENGNHLVRLFRRKRDLVLLGKLKKLW